MTITRLFALKSLKQQGYVPGQKTYMLNVKHFLIKQFHLENVDKKGEAALNKTANSFAYDAKKFYVNENGYRWDDFLTKKKEWLSKELKNPVPIPPVPKAAPKKKTKMGPPTKPYESKGRSGQYAEAAKIRSKNSVEALIHAAMVKANHEGKIDLADVLRQLHSSPVEEGSRFRKAMAHYNRKEEIVVFTPEEALALIIELGLSSRKYTKLRKKAKKKHAHFLPSYDPAVTNCMKKCKPKDIDLTKQDEVSVPMQSALDHQMLNILELPSVVKKHDELKVQCENSGLDYELKLFFKYGADGTSHQSQYQNVSAGL